MEKFVRQKEMNKFQIFMIDPPWPKKKGGKRSVRPNQDRLLEYNTISVDSIFDLLNKSIFPLADTQHTVFLWTIEEFLSQSEQKMFEQGYKRHIRLIWNKLNGIAPAFSVRYSHEYLIWFYKPKFTPVDKEYRGKFTSVFNEASREHSRKPDIAYKMVDKMFPSTNKIDVFSREKRLGWEQWGDQIGFFDKYQTSSTYN
jgi:N6-adenosine-specific RNA methylase IME4